MPLNLSISPAQLEIIIKPGTTITQAYQITNNSDQTVFLQTSVEPWLPLGTDGSLTYRDVSPNPNLHFSLSNANLNLGQTFKLPPQQSRQLVLKVKTDPSTPIADSYYTFFVSQSPSTSLTLSNTSQTRARLGSHLLITSSNQESLRRSAKFTDFQVKPNIIDSFFTPLTFTAQINNLSNHFFKTTGTLTIKKGDRQIQQFDIFPQNVLANHSRDLACTLYFDQQKLPPQPAPCTLKPPFWPGRYSATLTVDLSYKTTSKTLHFFTFPYTLFLAITLITGFLILIKKLLPKKANPPPVK